jgi:hypothetical protein
MAAAAACVASLGSLLAPPPAIADTVQNGCMQNVAGFALNCSSNDVRIAGVATNADGSPKLTINDNGCAYYGDSVNFTAEFLVNLGAQARYDIGIYFATDGDNNNDGALTGSCSVTSLDADNTSNFINLDASPDQCGDIDAAHNPLRPLITLTAVCIDEDNNGKLDLPNCVSWRQPGSNELCTDALDAFPGSPSKCKCDKAFNVPIEVPSATIEVTKTASPTTLAEPSGLVTYTVVVQNQGIDPNNAFSLNSLVDDKFGNLDGRGTCDVPQQIASGLSYSCQFDATVTGNAAQVHTNIVTASGADSRGNSDSDTDDASVTFTGVDPIISVNKTASPLSFTEPGANVTYTVTVTNNSVSTDPVTLQKISDDKFGTLAGDADCQVGTVLASGASCSFTFTRFVGGAPNYVHTNVVEVDAIDDDGSTASDSDDASVTVTNVPSAITVLKTASPGSLPEPGGSVTFTVLVTNNSTVDSVTISSISDDKFGTLAGDSDCQVGTTLARGASCSFTFIRNLTGDADDSHTNTVTVNGVDDDGEAVVDSEAETVNFTDVLPAATLTKTVTQVVATFQIRVTNDGTAESVDLTELTDTEFGDLIASGTCAVMTLAPSGQTGDTYTCTFTRTIRASDLVDGTHTNVATGTVVDDDNNAVEPAPSDDAKVSFE